MPAPNPYLDAQRVRAALRSLHLRPTRGMGQHFLIDPHALHQIVAAADLSPTDRVLEIGPGLGVLTWELLQHTPSVVAVELDKRLAARLHEEFSTTAHQPTPTPALHVVQADVLNTPPADLLREAQTAWTGSEPAPADLPPYKLVANLPYAITAPLLQHFLTSSHPPHSLVVLVQWEVAQRMCATSGKLSMRAHTVQMFAEPALIARVPASSFLPPPAVDSAILRLRLRDAPAVAVDNTEALFRLIKAAFLQPRKKLSNALPTGLKALGTPHAQAAVVAALEAAHIAPERRAETVSLEEWARLYRVMQQEH